MGALVGEILDHREQMADTACQAIEANNDKDVASGDIVDEPGEHRPRP